MTTTLMMEVLLVNDIHLSFETYTHQQIIEDIEKLYDIIMQHIANGAIPMDDILRFICNANGQDLTECMLGLN